MRINKYIASSGVCSRRNAEKYIIQGRVKVNGQVVTNLATDITSEDIVKLDDRVITIEETKRYIMLNKPKGYITTSNEQFNRPYILDLVDVNERVFPVGRLDMDTEGLILLTNDGDFANSIIHPTKHIAKTYEVTLRNDITDMDISKLESGVDIGGYMTRTANVVKINNKKIKITIYEGKNRQVRKMCEAVNNKVIYLKRISIGKLTLGNLKTGEYKELDKEEIDKIFK